jgi:class 3 adenylate cyclase/tetratricopeptide (TPR) repeat protein
MTSITHTALDLSLLVLCGYPAARALEILDSADSQEVANVRETQILFEAARMYFGGNVSGVLVTLDSVDWDGALPILHVGADLWRAKIYSVERRYRTAKSTLERIAEMSRTQGPEWYVAAMVAHWRLGLLTMSDGDMQQARELYRAARQYARILGLAREEAMLDSDIASVYLEIHDNLRAIELFSKSADALAALGEHHVADKIRINIATTLQRQGQHQEAVRAYEDVMNRSLDAYDPAVQLTCWLNAALCYRELGQLDRAQSIYERLEKSVLMTTGPEAHSRIRFAVANLRQKQGDLQGALAACIEADEALIERPTALSIEVEALRSELLWQEGRHSEAIEIMEGVYSNALRLDHRRILLSTSTEYSEWLASEGRFEDAYTVMCKRNALIEEARSREEERSTKISSMRNAIEQERVVMKAVDDQRRAILSNVMPPHVADRLMAGEPTIAEQREHVAVLFADIVNFSRLALELPAKDLVLSLEALFRSFDDVMDLHGCEKIKTIGDSYMATAGTTDVEVVGQRRRIIAAAIDMTRLVAERDDGLQVRVGMHVGPAVVGVMGGKRMTYDVWGDTVNIAARMESTGEPGRIQASDAVVMGLDSEFFNNLGVAVTPRGIIAPKGIAPLSTVWIDPK